MNARHTLAALAVSASLVAGIPAVATAAPAPGSAAATRQAVVSSSTAGFTDVMRFGSAVKGTPLAQTSPDANTVFTVIKRATQTPEIKEIVVDDNGAVVENHVYELTDTWRDGWTDAQVDASSVTDVWAVADGTLWHFAGGDRAVKVALPEGVTRAVAVVDVAGPDAYISAGTSTGARIYKVTSTARGTSFTAIANPDGVTAAAQQLRFVGNHLFAQYGTAVYELRTSSWKQVATAPSADATWLARSVNQHQFLTEKAVLTSDGTVVTERFTEVARNGRVTQLAGSTDDEVFTLAASRTGDAVWTVTRRGEDAYLQRYAG